MAKRTHDEIQASCAFVLNCVWPGCPIRFDDPKRREIRVGPLCVEHAVEIHRAIGETEEMFNREAELTPQRKAQIRQIERDIDTVYRRRKERAEATDIQPGWVYYVAVGERIKVGYAMDVRTRMRAYPPDTKLLAVHPGTPGLERQMHAKLSVSRVAGREWYDPSPTVMAHIDDVIAQFGEPPKTFAYEYRKPGIPKSTQRAQVRGYVGRGRR